MDFGKLRYALTLIAAAAALVRARQSGVVAGLPHEQRRAVLDVVPAVVGNAVGEDSGYDLEKTRKLSVMSSKHQ